MMLPARVYELLGVIVAINIWQPGYGMNDQGISIRFQVRESLFSMMSRLALGLSSPCLLSSGNRGLFPWKEQLYHEADSPSFSAKVKDAWNFVAVLHIQIFSWHCLIKHRE
jgi:hypothetical protein